MSEEAVSQAEERMKKTLASQKDTFAALRTGRAQASIFDKVRVECYSGQPPLAVKELGNISSPEARLLVIQPWDKSTIAAIEKAIRTDLSLNPSNDGKVIRVSIPPLTEERRKDLVKQAKASAEQSRVAIRNIRRDGNDELKKLQKDGLITEDGEKKSVDALQKLTNSYIEKIDAALKEKEKEILEV